MAIMVQEVTLRIVYDDKEIDGPPQTWAWQNTLSVGHANVGHAFEVTNVQGVSSSLRHLQKPSTSPAANS